MNCGVGRRHGSDLALLWFWRRLAATAPIQPQLSYAAGAALKRQNTNKQTNKKTPQKFNITYKVVSGSDPVLPVRTESEGKII